MMLLGNSRKEVGRLVLEKSYTADKQLVLHYITRHDLGFWCLGNVAEGAYKAYGVIGSV